MRSLWCLVPTAGTIWWQTSVTLVTQYSCQQQRYGCMCYTLRKELKYWQKCYVDNDDNVLNSGCVCMRACMRAWEWVTEWVSNAWVSERTRARACVCVCVCVSVCACARARVQQYSLKLCFLVLISHWWHCFSWKTQHCNKSIVYTHIFITDLFDTIVNR